MLNRMGAKISGISSNLLIVEGVEKLSGTSHRMLPDMIEIGSFIGLAAMTQSELTIKKAGVAHLGVIPEKFQQLGIKLEIRGDDIVYLVDNPGHRRHCLPGINPATQSYNSNSHKKGDNQDVAKLPQVFGTEDRFRNNQVLKATVTFMMNGNSHQFAILKALL